MDSDNGTTVKRGRGRPPKKTAGKTTTAAVKKGPSAMSKPGANGSAATSSGMGGGNTTAKRGRGRPPKGQSRSPPKKTGAIAKKPTKRPAAAGVGGGQAKRGRGRPPKNQPAAAASKRQQDEDEDEDDDQEGGDEYDDDALD